MSAVNHQFRLAAGPWACPSAATGTSPRSRCPQPPDGQFVVRISHLSLDPAMRGWMNEGSRTFRRWRSAR